MAIFLCIGYNCPFAILSCHITLKTLGDRFDLADAMMEMEIFCYNSEPQQPRQLVPSPSPGLSKIK